MVERRKHGRTPVQFALQFARAGEGSRRQGQAKDLSLGGMFFEAEPPPAFGENLDIYVQFPGTSVESKISAKVRWVEGKGVGVQFGSVGVRETQAISDIVRTRD
jgi:hypothetical protein